MRAIVDIGQLVDCSERSEQHRFWATERVEQFDALLQVCEPVLTEAAYLLARFRNAQYVVIGLLQNGALTMAFRLEGHVAALHRLPREYCNTPMWLADACVVRMAVIHENHPILALAREYAIYRKHGRVPMTLMHPALGRASGTRPE